MIQMSASYFDIALAALIAFALAAFACIALRSQWNLAKLQESRADKLAKSLSSAKARLSRAQSELDAKSKSLLRAVAIGRAAASAVEERDAAIQVYQRRSLDDAEFLDAFLIGSWMSSPEATKLCGALSDGDYDAVVARKRMEHVSVAHVVDAARHGVGPLAAFARAIGIGPEGTLPSNKPTDDPDITAMLLALDAEIDRLDAEGREEAQLLPHGYDAPAPKAAPVDPAKAAAAEALEREQLNSLAEVAVRAFRESASLKAERARRRRGSGPGGKGSGK